jgi:DNA repair protein RadC
MSNIGEPLSALPSHDRPRERLGRLGAAALADAEVLALVLGSGQHGRNVVALSQALLAQAGGFPGLALMNVDQLQNLPGIGPASASRVVAAIEMWRRSVEPSSGLLLTDSDSIAKVVLPELRHRTDERFLVVVGDRAQRFREIVRLRQGTDRMVKVESSEVVQAVFSRAGGTFALAHNHPGGSSEPSVADTAITRQIRVAARAVGLRFLDHLVVAGDEWRSIA